MLSIQSLFFDFTTFTFYSNMSEYVLDGNIMTVLSKNFMFSADDIEVFIKRRHQLYQYSL